MHSGAPYPDSDTDSDSDSGLDSPTEARAFRALAGAGPERAAGPATPEPAAPEPAPHPGLLAAAEYAEWLENVCPCAEASELGRLVRDCRQGRPRRDAGAGRAMCLLSAALQISALRARLEKARPAVADLLTVVRSLEPQAAAALAWVAEELADHARQVGEGARAAADEAVAVAISEEERASADRLLALSLADDERDDARRAAAAAQAVADAAEQDRLAARMRAEARMRPRDGAYGSGSDSDSDSGGDDRYGYGRGAPPPTRAGMPPAELLEDFEGDD